MGDVGQEVIGDPSDIVEPPPPDDLDDNEVIIGGNHDH